MLFIFDDYCGLQMKWVRHFFKSGKSTLWNHVFFYSFSIHHARDVIKMWFKVAYQKTKILNLLIKWLNWSFLTSYCGNGHLPFPTWLIILKHIHCWLLWAHVCHEKISHKPKIAKLSFFEFFFKWRHSDQKWSKVVPRVTEWANDHFWSYFRQKTYSWGILKGKV